MIRRAVVRALGPVAIVLALGVSLSSCSPPGFTVSTGPRETSVTGRLGGEARGDAGCAWIVTNAGEQIEVVYPNAWHVEFDPVALFDDAGRQVAAKGETIVVEGYFSDVGASACTPQRSFNATRVLVER